MPTPHRRKSIVLTEPEQIRLDGLRLELQKPGRRGTPLYIGLSTTLNQFIVRLALERAAQIEEELRASRRKVK